jgi:Flp pilus assembly protein TadD
MRRLMALCAAALVALGLGGAASAQGLPEVRLGNEAFREGDFARAVSHYTKAIRSGELVGEALAITYNNRGVAHGEAGNFDPAIADYSQALALRPNDSTTIRNLRVAHVRRGELEFASGAYDAAIADFSEAIALEPEHHIAFQRRGEVYTELGLLDRAIADLEQAVMLSPGDSEVVLALNRAIERRDQVAGTLGDDVTPIFSPPETADALPADSRTARSADALAPPSEPAEQETAAGTTAVTTEAPTAAEQTSTTRPHAEVAAAEPTVPEPAATLGPEPASGPSTEVAAAEVTPAEPDRVLDMTLPNEAATATASASTEAPAPQPRPEGAEGQPYRVVSAVNYRAGPENEAARLGTIDAGRIVRVTDDTLGWKHVILPNGDRGFIYKSWLEPVPE